MVDKNRPHVCKRNGDRRFLFVGIEEKLVRLDGCIAHDVAVANCYYYPTLASCCGHGKYHKTIVELRADGIIIDHLSGVMIPRKAKFYKKDTEGLYYIPEVEAHYG